MFRVLKYLGRNRDWRMVSIAGVLGCAVTLAAMEIIDAYTASLTSLSIALAAVAGSMFGMFLVGSLSALRVKQKLSEQNMRLDGALGSAVENTAWGDHHTPAKWNRDIEEGSIWAMWRNIAAQDPAFGRPDKFCAHTDKTSYESACIITRDDKIAPYIQKICQRDPYRYDSGPITGGLVTACDSNWMLSWNVERNPHFRNAPKNQLMIHAYGTYSLDRPGNYVKKALKDCTGEEIAREWLYHLGVPDHQINKLAAESVTVHPCMMPYITAFFMPRRDGDRPKVVPEGAVNFGFLGQLAESHPRDVIFTVEYSVRTAMEAVYTLLDIERGVPEPWGSQYDIRALLNSAIVMRDGEKLKLPAVLEAYLLNTEIGELLRDYGFLGELGDNEFTVAIHKNPPRVTRTVL
jgi:oleate hydratase